MSEEKTTGMDRRTVLRRGALLGGALVWTTPVVQSLGGTALAATGTAAGGGGGTSTAPSYVFTWIKCVEVDSSGHPVAGGSVEYYSVKWNQDGSHVENADKSQAGEIKNAGSTVNKAFDDRYGPDATKWTSDYTKFDVTGAATSSGLRLTLPAGCQIENWFMHDGSCLDKQTGADKWRWDGDGDTTSTVGPQVPTTLAFDVQSFTFTQC